jgi:hypothetical protein
VLAGRPPVLKNGDRLGEEIGAEGSQQSGSIILIRIRHAQTAM